MAYLNKHRISSIVAKYFLNVQVHLVKSIKDQDFIRLINVFVLVLPQEASATSASEE